MRRLRFVFSGVLLLIFAVLLIFLGRNSGETKAMKMSEESDTASNALPPANKPTALERTLELAQAFLDINHKPIEFYGRVMDQYGSPVPDVAVEGGVQYNTGGESGLRKAYTTTDDMGYFSFTGLEGQDLGIGLSKEGYEYGPIGRIFSYSEFAAEKDRYVPDPGSPFILTLWKKQGPETLIYYFREWRIPIDGSAVGFDLSSGKISDEGADLVISIIRDPLRMPFGTLGYAWHAEVTAVEGGMIRVGRQQYYNLAPEMGYLASFEYSQESRDQLEAKGTLATDRAPWSSDFDDDFFIKSQGGRHFAHVRLGIVSNADSEEGDNIGAVRALVWLNPNGSRNLEFDPAKAITPPRVR